MKGGSHGNPMYDLAQSHICSWGQEPIDTVHAQEAN